MTAKMVVISNARLSFPDLEKWPVGAALIVTSEKDAVPLDTDERRFAVFEHRKEVSPQIFSGTWVTPAHKTQALARAITAEGQRQVRKLLLSQAYGNLKSEDRSVRGSALATINFQYGKYASRPDQFDYDVDVYSAYPEWFRHPPYNGPLIIDLWTSATYPLGIPERRFRPDPFNVYHWFDETATIPRHTFEDYCRADVELTKRGYSERFDPHFKRRKR